MLAPLVAVTSNYIISGEARKCQKDVAEFAEYVMRTIDYFGLYVDIQLACEDGFSMILYQNYHPIIEITA